MAVLPKYLHGPVVLDKPRRDIFKIWFLVLFSFCFSQSASEYYDHVQINFASRQFGSIFPQLPTPPRARNVANGRNNLSISPARHARAQLQSIRRH